ncbi:MULTISPECIES: GntR family transcriptional regulator [Rhizobium/Agrobacterium group]|jgi:DNA-binding GntR family transcriptional regulator|uniref:GntR family transcriptional regulator n=1 Tax=Agrobacterium tumefaciens TaxID=358 RepID=A0AA44J9K6_AGRTU|nr:MULTISPECIES: GntR family transcriptional regulator [Rhizobium/Agrobacterium group]AHK03917.1 GntR family transcriptional regulator [Agrobacterium tumefaciens LBA4213 (Ach5)]AKC09669.1 GntR family transcriptional regulator [Agrobacterium tumefaciens]EHJ96034.1 GntR family transcriptional regulator [Agrobacterium tumefaciens 5A]MDP9562771.1 DNA-binding GntR family transcriptional regulator [Rhizobium nepotum]ADY67216.1 transcriptional regulator, GntR family [Agrobacterium tumefaciens]
MNTLIKVTLADQAHQELRARIVSGRLRGGERLLPNELAADLGISPTPVKEACLKLEADGLVVNSSRRGMVVRDFTVEDVEELYAARMLLEKGAVEVAFDAGQLDEALHAQLLESLAKHREFATSATLDDLSKALFHDRSFHTALVSAARIPVISGTHGRILDQTHTVFVSILGDYARSVEEHQNIADAIAARSKAQIIDALWRHLERSRQNTLRQVRLLREAGA